MCCDLSTKEPNFALNVDYDICSQIPITAANHWMKYVYIYMNVQHYNAYHITFEDINTNNLSLSIPFNRSYPSVLCKTSCSKFPSKHSLTFCTNTSLNNLWTKF